MALTRKDLQLIREILKPEFDGIAKRFNGIDKKLIDHDKKFEAFSKKFEEFDERFEEFNEKFEEFDVKFEEFDKKFEKSDRKFESIKAYIDRRFDEQNNTMMQGFKEIVNDVFGEFYKVDERFDIHEGRITNLENQNPS